LAAADDAAEDSDHFAIGLTAMLDGFGKHLGENPRGAQEVPFDGVSSTTGISQDTLA